MPESDKELPDITSKSSQKKEMQKLRDVGARLLSLPPSKLAQLPLPDELRELIAAARSITSHGAKKRHMQYVGKKIREMDVEVIEVALSRIDEIDTQNDLVFHQSERWRDKLIDEGDSSLQEFIKSYSGANVQELRQLIRNAQKDKNKGQDMGGAKMLFRYLHRFLKSFAAKS